MSKISVVVPVYKVEKYLERCIKSILLQSYSDFELVLVDDGSPDMCPKICDDISKQDDRVTVIHRENGGLSAARNSGIDWAIENSNSKWITFIDSDDWVHPQYLESLLLCAKKTNSDVVMCEFSVTDTYDNEYIQVTENNFSVEATEDAFRNEVLDPNSSCGRLFKKELFSDVRFPVGKLHEDRFTTYKILFQFEKVGVVGVPMYYYFINNDGIIHSSWSPRRLDNLEATENQLSFFKERGMDEMYEFTFRDYLHTLIYYIKQTSENSDLATYEKQLRETLKRAIENEGKIIGLNMKDDFNVFKYAYPIKAKIYRRLVMR